MKKINDAMKQDHGNEVARFLLGQRYIEAYSNISKSPNNTIVMNSNPAEVQK